MMARSIFAAHHSLQKNVNLGVAKTKNPHPKPEEEVILEPNRGPNCQEMQPLRNKGS